MKRIVIILLVVVINSSLFAQVETGGVKFNFGGSAGTYNQTGTDKINLSGGNYIKTITFQIGTPFLGLNKSTSDNPFTYGTYDRKFKVGFPWGELLVNKTFSYDRFTVSKGYFADRIELNWSILNNGSAITNIEVYRTEDIDSDNPSWGRPIQVLAKSATSYSDNTAETGKLYRYKVKALGVISQDPDSELNNFLIGVGYRNQMGIVTGNISYKGGNPVKDVLVSAIAEGASNQIGSSLLVPSDGKVWLQKLNKSLKDSFSIQLWAKYANNNSSAPLNLFKILSDANSSILVTAQYVNNGNTLRIKVGDAFFDISGFIPNGKLNNRGDDQYDPISSFIDNYIHFTVVFKDGKTPLLYINGRPMTADYFTYLNNLLPSGSSATLTTSNLTALEINTTSSGSSISWNSFELGGGVSSYIDDFRAWSRALFDQDIRTTYKRYLRGDENGMIVYLRFDENAGKRAYDLSFKGNIYNNNSGIFSSNSSIAGWWSPSTPNIDQLGVFGVTDVNGNYSIAAIPYKGAGELFKITPSLGVHKFDPKQETLFIGAASSVVNRVNFIDISSFTFRGRAIYDSRGVFPKGPSSDDVTGDIKDDEAYNAYVVGSRKYPKGEYWGVLGTSGIDAGRIVRLQRYAPIAVDGANIFIDNNMVLDENNNPVLTDKYGRFNIQVPIGNHSITVKKNGHIFLYDGRFPAKDSALVNNVMTYTSTYKEFFENSDEETIFLDNTKVTLVGRVVGGKIESSKPIGFGHSGAFNLRPAAKYGPSNANVTVSSNNNIGTASITLGYRSPGASTITNEFKTTFTTNSVTGEYKVDILPLMYELNRSDLFIASQNTEAKKRFLTENLNFNYSEIPPLQRSSFLLADTLNRIDTLAKSAFFHYQKDHIYMATPEIAVLNQAYDTTITIGDSTYNLASNATPLYTQLNEYQIKFQRQEKYYNYEKALANQLNIVPASDGGFVITNSLAVNGSESIETDKSNPSISIYSFKAGQVNADINSGFLKSISALYRLNGTDYPISGLKTNGIILGGVADGSQGFITQGPDVVDMILRDPPGSASSATIQKGSSFSIMSKNSGIFDSQTKVDIQAVLGVKFSVGDGILAPQVETENTSESGARFIVKLSNENGKGVTTTYTFADAISTSSSPSVVGSSADLYIGKSINYYYGLIDFLKGSEVATTSSSNASTSIPINTTKGVKYISRDKAISFSPEGTPTTFIFSQDYVLNQLLPQYEDILFKIRRGQLVPGGSSNIKDSTYYINSIQLWKEAIVRNEAQKYRAYKERDNIKNDIREVILSKYRDVSGATLSKSGRRLKQILDEQFYRNLSLDALVGSFTGSSSVETVTSWNTSFLVGAGVGAVIEAKATTAGSGIKLKIENENTINYKYDQEENVTNTLDVSYSLSDPDPLNSMSVDVVNCFDGNSPVFILRGGASSCPVESSEKSKYFTVDMLKAIKADTLSKLKLVQLEESKKVELTKGSIALEKPELSVANASLSGIPETGKAEFVFTLANSSQLEPSSSSFKLKINPVTNPNGAKLSIDANGVPITLNGSKAIKYTVFVEKGAANVFNYDSLEVVLESSCDANVSKSVFISARFIQSCTKVEIARPSNNWVVNTSNAYSNNVSVPLPIVLNGFRTDYAGFGRIVLQYRLQGTPSWTLLRNYVKDQAAKTALVSQGADASLVDIINGTELNYAWDIPGTNMADGTYEIRAVSFCSNGTIFETSPVVVKVDLVTPVLFGTPSPTDGILSIGEDLKIRFSEPVKKNGTLTRVDFVVQDNQLPVDHSVALSFTGNNSRGTITSPFIKEGDVSIEFWLRNASTASGSIISQANGFYVSVSNNSMSFAIGSNNITSSIATDGLYHHYVATYNGVNGKMTLIQDDAILKSENKAINLISKNNSNITLGSTQFIGKIHDLRIWNIVISRETAVANMYAILKGDEDGLIGYWIMGEGNGNLAKDIARSKHITLSNVGWDIFPNTQSYSFDGNNYLTLANASKSIFSSTMDGTISFWMKTNTPGPATLLSNGKGDLSDPQTSSGYRNKWAIDLDNGGVLKLKAEGKTYSFGSKNIADGSWHHVAIVLRRKANMTMYIDGASVQDHPIAGLGGFSGSAIFVGARGQISSNNQTTIDQNFTGQIDDVCIWNLAKQSNQIVEDMFYEQNFQSLGLVLYAPMNQPIQAINNGPKYWVPLDAQNKVSEYALLSPNSALKYSSITPPIKPLRNTINIVTNAVVNGDEMIIEPQVSDWASIEKKIAYITVANMYDMSDNRQESPITWTAFVNKNPLKWYIDGYDNNLNVTLNQGKSDTYQLVIVNVGGTYQNFSFDLPSFLSAKTTSGIIAPNSQVKIPITVNTNLSPGKYFDLLKLKSNFNYNEQIQANLRVLTTEPNLNFDPSLFEENMNIIGKLRVNGVFSKDLYSKVIAYHLDSIRGVGSLEYDDKYDSYFVLMNVYGNTENVGDEIIFKIWDATDGILKAATINNADSIIFQPNAVLGSYQAPVVFDNSSKQTQILNLNQGWTWVSFNVRDPRFFNLDSLFKRINKSRGDLIKSYNPTLFDVYNVSTIPGETGWLGSISLNGGIDTLKSYRIRLSAAQKMILTGVPLSLATSFNLTTNWNNLPYIASRNLPLKDALSGFDAQDGDQIKSQSQFAIFDGVSKSWKGNLSFMSVGQGYMIKASRAQSFSYPSYANNIVINKASGETSGSIITHEGSSGPQNANIPLDGDTVYNGIKVVTPSLDASLLAKSETMNMIAVLPDGYDDVSFFVNGVPISYAQKIKVENKDLFFITLYGDVEAQVKAVLVKGSVKTEALNIIKFTANATLGTLKSPYTFKLIEPEEILVMKAYPNPFSSDITLEFNSSIDGTGFVQLLDISSRLIQSKQIQVSKGNNKYRYSPNYIPANVYTIQVIIGDKVQSKVVMKN